MPGPPIIEFENISKLYRLGETGGSLREAITRLGRAFARRTQAERRATIWALRDVSFSVGAGEALGIIGPNGAGKTTIFKLLSNITQCTAGNLRVDGRVASLIELGAGFHPDLTGRENIYLNGAILGMNRRQIRERFDEIVSFSGLDGFLDTPVKRYSSGMYARLGFSIAVHTDADVLLVDEVLAVGDIAFQAKSVQRMRELVSQGRTVVFISHSMYYVNHFCDRVILLDQGRIREQGPPQKVISAFQSLMYGRAAAGKTEPGDAKGGTAGGRSPVQVVDVQTLDADGNPCEAFNTGETLVVRVRGRADERISEPVFEVAVFSQDGVLCCNAHSKADGARVPEVFGNFEVCTEFPDLRLLPNSYSVSVRILDSTAIAILERKEFWKRFQVADPGLSTGVENGLFYMPHRWTMHWQTPADRRTHG